MAGLDDKGKCFSNPLITLAITNLTFGIESLAFFTSIGKILSALYSYEQDSPTDY